MNILAVLLGLAMLTGPALNARHHEKGRHNNDNVEAVSSEDAEYYKRAMHMMKGYGQMLAVFKKAEEADMLLDGMMEAEFIKQEMKQVRRSLKQGKKGLFGRLKDKFKYRGGSKGMLKAGLVSVASEVELLEKERLYGDMRNASDEEFRLKLQSLLSEFLIEPMNYREKFWTEYRTGIESAKGRSSSPKRSLDW